MFKNQTVFKYFFTFFFFFICFFSFFKAFSQDFDTVETLLMKIRKIDDQNERLKLANSTDSVFFNVIKNQNILSDYPQELKKYTSFLISDDKKVAVITWNIFLNDGEYKYFGYIKIYGKNGKSYTYRLIDKSDEIKSPEKAKLTTDNWFGCLYYEMITRKAGKTTYYTLLGWDGNDLLSNKKVVEVLTVKDNVPYFGYKFNIEGKTYKRLIFEYNEQAKMVLHWDENVKMIVWDHLSPSEPKYEGLYQFYGPDFSYDGLVFKKKQWVYVKDIYVKNTDKPKYESNQRPKSDDLLHH